MSNTRDPDPIEKGVEAISTDNAAGENKALPETRGGTTTEVPRRPYGHDKTTQEKKDPYEHRRTAVMGLTLFVACCALVVSYWSYENTKEKGRARVVASGIYRDPDLPLSFSLRFKNVGETTALNTYGAWLQGECQPTSSPECVEWCLQPIEEAQREGYGPLVSQDEHVEEFSHTLKMGKARKNQRPVYFCGYFAYTDVFCVWRRQFYAVFYDPATDRVSSLTLINDKEEAQGQNCRP